MAIESLERLDLSGVHDFVPPLEGEISYEDFLKRYDGYHVEWIDGRVELRSFESIAHQRIMLFLTVLLKMFSEEKEIGGAVFLVRFNMKLAPLNRGREPDVMYVTAENMHRVQHTHLDGAADLVVEIISDESEERDRVTKFREYERGGVREYWILDPETATANFYVRNDTGIFQEVLTDADGIYRSAVLPGFWIKTAWLWESPQPTLRYVLAQWDSASKEEHEYL